MHTEISCCRRLKIIKREDNALEPKTEHLFVAIRYSLAIRTRDQRRRHFLALNKPKEL